MSDSCLMILTKKEAEKYLSFCFFFPHETKSASSFKKVVSQGAISSIHLLLTPEHTVQLFALYLLTFIRTFCLLFLLFFYTTLSFIIWGLHLVCTRVTPSNSLWGDVCQHLSQVSASEAGAWNVSIPNGEVGIVRKLWGEFKFNSQWIHQ